MADALDSKSSGFYPCRFESGHRHVVVAYFTYSRRRFLFKKTNQKLIGENAISHPFHPLLLSEKGHARAACSVDKRPHNGFGSLTTFFGNKAVAEIRRPAKVSRVFHLFATAFSFIYNKQQIILEKTPSLIRSIRSSSPKKVTLTPPVRLTSALTTALAR